MAYLWPIITFLLWAVLHSITAASAFKSAVRKRIGRRAYDGFYRLAYNLFSVLSIVPVLLALAIAVPARTVWRWPGAWSFVAIGLQLVGLVGLLISLLQTDVLSFAGLRQVWRYFRGEPQPEAPGRLVRSGTYALVRHPLYLFSLLVLWFTPVMTLNGLLFSLLATFYFWIGSLHEERRLLAEFGEEYRQYQSEVPHLIPFTRHPVKS